jgi:flagellar P-ring protein precursor FlgI
LVEHEIPTEIVQDHRVDLLLRDPDFTSAARMAAAINETFTNSALAIDPMTVRVRVPEELENASVDFIARLEAVEMIPDTPSRIIISERTGTIVATSRIQISSCAVSHGDLTITIANTFDVSQPNALSQTGTTTTTPRTDAKVSEKKATLITLNEMPTVEKVAAGLNAIGVTPRDMMAIFEAMKQAGALQAELVLR